MIDCDYDYDYDFTMANSHLWAHQQLSMISNMMALQRLNCASK